MKKNTITRIISYMRPYKALLSWAFISALLCVPLALLSPVLVGRAIDHVLGKGNVNFDEIMRILFLLCLSITASILLQWFMLVCARKLSARAAQDLRNDALASVHSAPLSRIDSHPHGDLVSRLVNDVDAVGEGLLQGISQLFPGAIAIISTIIVMLTLSIPIALVVIIVTPLSIVFARFISKRTSKMFKAQTAAQGALSAHVSEAVTNQQLLRSFGGEESSAKEFETLNNSFYESNFKATFYSSVSNPGTRFVNAIVYAAVGIIGALTAIQGQISIGGLSAFLSFANQYTKPFNEVTSVLTQLQNAVASAERLFAVIDWEAEAPDAENAKSPISSTGNVHVKDIFFSYEKTRPLIQNLSLEAKPGQRIALVGTTGCGKTTLINLLMRFYEVDKGEILVDNNPILDINRNALRRLYGMVLQDTWLKNATVKENIAYACPGAAQTEIISAAKAAFAHGFITRLENGYDTMIEAGGGNLSAGQKQLLCIARIILAKPDILILDEATSSIDTRTEVQIQKALDKLMEGHTSFIVAHRLSTIQNADCIIVMDAGKIVERGNHFQLLAEDGFYAKLYNSQFAID